MNILLIVFFVILLLIFCTWIFLQQPAFGKMPSGKRLEIIKRSPTYKNGQFQNIHFTPNLTEGVSIWTVMRKFFFSKSKRNKPSATLPSIKTNLLNLHPEKNLLIWFGHSSYYMQIDGKKILVDPVFSGSASPLSFTTKSFKGGDVYTTGDMPAIDYLFLSHDHWDHLDYQTVLKLKPKIKQVITGAGTAAHLERWGYDTNSILEKDWNEKIDFQNGFVVNIVPARHFAGRGIRRNKANWASFVLQTPSLKLFLGGDSGYDTHFAKIGKDHGPFDLAILECGQYNQYWKYIHMMPEEMLQAGIDLRAKRIFPVHWGKFSLAIHDWDEPIKRAVKEAAKRCIPLIHPMIGQAVDIVNPGRQKKWWEEVK